MIKKITISNEASYGKEPVVISDLKEINYFFGANASGKTTISRVIEKKNLISNGVILHWNVSYIIRTLLKKTSVRIM